MAWRDAPVGLAGADVALRSLLGSLLDEVPPAPADRALNDRDPRPLTRLEGQSDLHAAVPDWAVDGFRALLFRSGDFRFAMPLILMCGVARLAGKVHVLPGQPNWQTGLVGFRGRRVVLAELAGLLGTAGSGRGPARYLLVLGDGYSAVGCDALEDMVRVEPDAVRWRAGATGRSWLLGLLKGPMCVLLDAGALDRQIRHG